jgi:ferredoxin-NADP reductase
MNQARVVRVAAVAVGVLEVELAMVEPPSFEVRPGQYVTIVLPGGEERRSYSVASPPGAGASVLLLIRNTGGPGSRFWTELRPDTPIEFEGPRGAFVLEERHPGDLVFAATGVGASAIFPMMEEALGRDHPGGVAFCWGMNRREDLFWHDRLAAMTRDPRFRPEIVFAELGQGYVTPRVIDHAGQLRSPTFYVCGNGQMVRDIVDGLTARGVDRARIRCDHG